MTDKEKIKLFIIRQDLEIKQLTNRLNVTGLGALMMLRESTKDLEPKGILELVDKLAEPSLPKSVATTDGDINMSC